MVTDQRQTGREATTHRPSAEERGLAAAKETTAKPSPATKPAPKAPANVDALYLHHSGRHELERDVAFGKIRHPGAKRIRITSWKSLAQVLGAYNKIGTLILMTHGHAGGLKLDEWKTGSDAGAFLAKTGAQADKIFFEGCMIMRSPIEAAQVAAGLKASTATGYNWWHYTGMQVFTLTKPPADKDTLERVDAWVTDFGQFLIRQADGSMTQPSTKTAIIDDLEAKATALKKQKKAKGPAATSLFTEWFHPDKTGGKANPTVDPSRQELVAKNIDDKSDARLFAKLDHTKPPAFQVTVDVAKLS